MEDKYNDEMYDTLRDNEGDTEQCFCPSYYKVGRGSFAILGAT